MLFVNVWNISLVVPSHSGPGSRHLYPATVEVSTCRVQLSMPPRLSWDPVSVAMWALVERIRGRSPSLSPHLPAISSLAVAANHPEWVCLDIMDVPIHQRSLSIVIDEAVYSHLLSTAPDIRFRALVLSSSLVHAGDWLNVVPSAYFGLGHVLQRLCCSPEKLVQNLSRTDCIVYNGKVSCWET